MDANEEGCPYQPQLRLRISDFFYRRSSTALHLELEDNEITGAHAGKPPSACATVSCIIIEAPVRRILYESKLLFRMLTGETYAQT